MQIRIETLDTVSDTTGAVVVIDVWRSLTTAAIAFSRGANSITATELLDEAIALHRKSPETLLIGIGEHLAGPPPDGFDYVNSPTLVNDADVKNRAIILCTPNGTLGLVRAIDADILLGGSLVCATATVNYLKQCNPSQITLLITEYDEPDREDEVCAKYMESLLKGTSYNIHDNIERIRKMGRGRAASLLEKGRITETQRDILNSDLDYCLSLDRFDFTMVATKTQGLPVLWRV